MCFPLHLFAPALLAVCLLIPGFSAAQSEMFELEKRSRQETSDESGRFHFNWQSDKWDPDKTAIIVCDMWDSHHSVTAARRVGEMAPRLNAVLKEIRRRGGVVVHSPSDCMGHYAEHVARKNALAVPKASDYPKDIGAWCHKIPEEERARYPIDQSDGGEDESAWENDQWAARLKADGRNPGTPWKTQHPALEISEDDYVAAEGDVVWNILKHEGIEHVVLAGVHTNMCVLGRPFGLRRMVAAKMETVLLRDCTDLMYNPARWPYVNHFTGLDLIIEYIEANVCPTITSDQIVGGEAFRYAGDRRPHLVVLIGEKEYKTAESLPKFARRFLGKDFRVSFAYADVQNRHLMPGVRLLDDADLLLVSVRRRGLPEEDLATIRRFVASGKPVIGIRTASHAFAPKDEIPEGNGAWAEFDAEVFGGNYTGHHGGRKDGSIANFVWLNEAGEDHPVVESLPDREWKTTSWLYKTSPLAAGTQVVAMGRVEGVEKPEPLAWTYTRSDGGRSFYTSLGHIDDFSDPNFQRLLVNAVYWSADLQAPGKLPIDPDVRRWQEDWTPMSWDELSKLKVELKTGEHLWIRTLLRMPSDIPEPEIVIGLDEREGVLAYLNGKQLKRRDKSFWKINRSDWKPGDLNLLVFGRLHGVWPERPPMLMVGSKWAFLSKSLQVRKASNTKDLNVFPIPPQFGAPADLIQDWPTDLKD